jgi:hypothetical protein
LFHKGPTIHEVNIDWLCNINGLIDTFKLKKIAFSKEEFTLKKFSNAINSTGSCTLSSTHSTSQTSLVSNASFNSIATTSTISNSNNNNHNVSFSSTASGKTSVANAGVYTALCCDSSTNKILAAKCDKQKTVIEIYNSNCTHDYSIESSQNEKVLKRVTSMSCTNDGRVVCVDLCANLIKMFRFI